ncbi:cilia- and flagella-associated protein 70 isoform X1 [Salvelinus fontinalis]|uniref:cilia- and flagella-associated protein 70 isoform X1 n=1 Tax=Salvelinus fontinalis TaxID=8038 RepID=UPI0024859EED|nr:cilia- and flagella-associated protein 70 isoform X1 [Salvelinus fontinalis]
MEQFRGARDKVTLVKITVLRGNNLRGNKAECILNYVRAEFNGIVLGDSQKLDAAVDQSVDYNFTCSFECSDAAHTLDDMAHKPVILTVIEVLPKEKKQKEEKTAVIGQAIVDLLPLLHGQVSFFSTVLLHPTPGSPAEAASQEGSCKPSLDVTVCVPEPLLSGVQLSDSNLLKVTVETAYSVPEVWNPVSGSGPPSSYVAALQVPLTAEKEQVLMFSNGLLKVGGESEPMGRPRKWPLGPLLAPGAQFIPGVSMEGEPIEMEDGDLTSIEDRDFRKEAETNKKRVSWDTERRCFLDADGAACLTHRIAESRLWPVEVMRSPQVGATKGGKAGKDKGGEDETQLSFHGVAYVDMAPLLYPGARRVRGAYRLYPFYDSDLLVKAKRNISVLRESIRAPATQGRGRAPSSVGSCKAIPSKLFDGGHKGGKDTKESPKRPGTQGKSAPIGSDSVTLVETEQQQQVNTEGQMYADSRTYIIIEIALEKSLVPKRSPEELAKRVMELIPPRAPLPRRPAGAERAVQEYQAQIASVAGQVLEQYQQLFGPAFLPGEKPLDPTSQEQRKTKLLGELNYSGKYFAFKEQIKYSVVRIVREKMLRTEAFSDPEQLQAFLSQLYVFLVDEMHVALNKTLSVDAQETQPRPLVDCAQLVHFAKEAQLNGDYQLAAQYYQEQLTRDRSDPAHWFDYGVLYMLTADYQKAEECFHYAVSMEQTHLPSLLMCGILAEMDGRLEEAETFFEGATCVDPANVVAWTLFGLFYEGQENSIQTEMAFLEATKQQRAALVVTPPCRVETRVESPDLGEEEQEVANCESLTIKPDVDGDTEASVVTGSQSCQGSMPGEGYKGGAEAEPSAMRHLATPTRLNTTIYMETVQFLLQNNALQMAQRALAQELLCPEGGLSSSYHLALARLQLLRAEYGSAESSLKEALNDSFQDPDVWALFGHIHHLTGEFGKAQECYERTLDFVTDATDTHPIYLRLGSIYLQEGEFQRAKTTYLRACKSSPSCLTWLGLGIACYRLGELTEAEDALTEANILNNGNAEVWGYLSLVCLQTGRRLEAEQSYKYALKLNFQKEAVLREIKALQDHVGFGNPCF